MVELVTCEQSNEIDIYIYNLFQFPYSTKECLLRIQHPRTLPTMPSFHIRIAPCRHSFVAADITLLPKSLVRSVYLIPEFSFWSYGRYPSRSSWETLWTVLGFSASRRPRLRSFSSSIRAHPRFSPSLVSKSSRPRSQFFNGGSLQGSTVASPTGRLLREKCPSDLRCLVSSCTWHRLLLYRKYIILLFSSMTAMLSKMIDWLIHCSSKWWRPICSVCERSWRRKRKWDLEIELLVEFQIQFSNGRTWVSIGADHIHTT